ncbi:hypothetical protein GCM10010504_00010 [Streptomyces griseus]|nr:hypothetical protein GCM10010504_00010 [Streptomyces griseus]
MRRTLTGGTRVDHPDFRRSGGGPARPVRPAGQTTLPVQCFTGALTPVPVLVNENSASTRRPSTVVPAR